MDRFAGLTDCAAMARSGFGKRFPARNSALSRTLAANIRRLRKERGWTQDDLAAEANVRQAAISLIESGRANPTLLMLETVINALDVGFVDLLTALAKPPLRQGNRRHSRARVKRANPE